MTLSTKNFAQIKETENIEIKDFNVFIGKNGSGKTYFAKLIYFLNSFKYKLPIIQKLFSKKLKNSFDNKSDILFGVEEQENFKKLFINFIQNSYPNLIGAEKELFKNFTLNIDITFQEFSLPFQEEIETFKDYENYITTNYIFSSFNIAESHYLPAARANYMITYKWE